MKRIEVKLTNGQVERERGSLVSVEPEVEQRGGASLAQDIVDDLLRKLDGSLRTRSSVDPEQVRSLKDMVSVLSELRKLERGPDGGLPAKIAAMTKAELLEAMGARMIGEEE